MCRSETKGAAVTPCDKHPCKIWLKKLRLAIAQYPRKYDHLKGKCACREGMGKSPLEKLHSQAIAQTCASEGTAGAVLSGAAEPVYLRHIYQLMEDYLVEYTAEHVLRSA